MDENELDDAVVEDNEDVVVEDQPADTETETVPTDTETETADEKDPVAEAFEEAGLSGQFTDPADALRRIPHFNSYLDALNKTNAAQAARLEALETEANKPVRPSAEEVLEGFGTDPARAMEDAGFARSDDVVKQNERMARIEHQLEMQRMSNTLVQFDGLKNVASAYHIGQRPRPGVNELWDEMNIEADKYPGLNTAPFETQLQVVYPAAKRRVDARKKPPVAKVPADEKLGATTTGGGSAAARR